MEFLIRLFMYIVVPLVAVFLILMVIYTNGMLLFVICPLFCLFFLIFLYSQGVSFKKIVFALEMEVSLIIIPLVSFLLIRPNHKGIAISCFLISIFLIPPYLISQQEDSAEIMEWLKEANEELNKYN